MSNNKLPAAAAVAALALLPAVPAAAQTAGAAARVTMSDAVTASAASIPPADRTRLAGTAAQSTAGAAPQTAQAAQARCGYDECTYTKKKYKGRMSGHNFYGNKCTTFDHAFKIRSLKITSPRGTTYWSKKGCKGTPSKSFAGNVSIPNYRFTARSSRP
ncbi:hypothetical protein [Nonomuraea sp. NPDC003709]|uniref:hypothetical protein n=1 Tax=Nonomuraea sp. NPDC003709 TaxID=3154450 RepID=UPI0033B8838F